MKFVLVAVFVLTAGVATLAQQGGSLAAARDLYAAALYDEALAVLDALRAGDGVDQKTVEQYRALCLLALGHAAEAENALAAVVTADPTYQPSAAEASPRVRATFADVRQRLLPGIATARYVAAKAAFDRREWASAEQQFRLVLALVDDPDTAGRLADLRILVTGFLELAARAAAPPPDPEPAPEPPAAAPPERTVPAPREIYSMDDEGVVPPATIRQDIPNIPKSAAASARSAGLLELVIDEQGRVASMTLRRPIHPTYDSQLLVAARDWKYRPATVAGQPVKFRKLINIAVSR